MNGEESRGQKFERKWPSKGRKRYQRTFFWSSWEEKTHERALGEKKMVFILGLLHRFSKRKLVNVFLFGLISEIAKGLGRTHILKKKRKEKVPEIFSGVRQ